MPPTEYPWLTYARARAHEADAARLGVSAVARAPRGFMREYEAAGTAAAMRERPLPPGVTGGATWGQKRHNFVRRFLAQYKASPTPRRLLAMRMWAYEPPRALTARAAARGDASASSPRAPRTPRASRASRRRAHPPDARPRSRQARAS